jgi:antirestriction protein ArdC
MTADEASAWIAAAFEAGVAPWSRWDRRLQLVWGLPVNAATWKPIRGVNTWLLELSAIENGYRNRFWGTRRQWWELGADVVRHEGTPIVAAQEGGERLLYNVEQVEVRRGAPLAALDRFWIAPQPADYALARRLVDATGARIVVADQPCYCRVGDRDLIGMPPVSRCVHVDDFWWVMLHELCHSVAMGPGRLCWDRNAIQNELVANLGAAILSARCGIPARRSLAIERRHPLGDLVEAWIGGIRGDVAYLADACDVAWKAADFVLAMSQTGVKA